MLKNFNFSWYSNNYCWNKVSTHVSSSEFKQEKKKSKKSNSYNIAINYSQISKNFFFPPPTLIYHEKREIKRNPGRMKI